VQLTAGLFQSRGGIVNLAEGKEQAFHRVEALTGL
jgi:hypothetical protein